jgi:3-oxoadipate enol-lactonase
MQKELPQMAQWKTELVPPAPRIAVDHTGEGKLVICMHGIGGNRTNWHDQLPDFGRHFHAASWDARGYGMSDDYEGPLDFHDFARDLVRVLDHFGARKAHLVGLSMGGLIAMDFNARFPERVATLTICDSLPGFSHISPEQSREFIRLRLEPLRAGKELKTSPRASRNR